MTLCWQNIRNLKYLSSIICTPNVIYFVHLTDTYRYDQSHWIIRLHEHVRASQHSSDYSLQLISSKFLLRIQCNTLTPQLRIDSDHFTLVKEKKKWCCSWQGNERKQMMAMWILQFHAPSASGCAYGQSGNLQSSYIFRRKKGTWILACLDKMQHYGLSKSCHLSEITYVDTWN